MKIVWPAQFNRQCKAATYLQDTLCEGRSRIRNIATSVALLDTGIHQFPITINQHDDKCADGEPNSYVVSPSSAYIDYALDELRRLDSRLPKWPLVLFIKSIRMLFKLAAVDRILQINNWMLSTNLYPADWQGGDIGPITKLLIEAFPRHAIAFRSLNEFSNLDLIAAMEQRGYLAIPSRQVYVFKFSGEEPVSVPHNVTLDKKLLEKSGYKIVDGRDLSEADFYRLEILYNRLYLEKYCRLNPQYTAEWLKAGCDNGWLELRALKSRDGSINGVVGWFSNERILTAPIVGYDTGLPKASGLYRMLTYLCIAEAKQRHTLLNFSSGAAHFKRLRGGEPSIEYTLVYINHLSGFQRCVWRLLNGALRMIAVPLMKKLKL